GVVSSLPLHALPTTSNVLKVNVHFIARTWLVDLREVKTSLAISSFINTLAVIPPPPFARSHAQYSRTSEVTASAVAPTLRLSAECVMASYGEALVVAMATLQMPQNDPAVEDRARRTLESFGLVELDSLQEYARLSARGDYIVDLDGDIDALCSFSALVV